MSKIKPNSINRQKMDWLFSQPIDIQLSIARQHFEIVRIVLNSILEGSVCELAGEKYKRSGPHGNRYQRWGFNPGSIRVGGQKIKMDVPRVFDRQKGKHVALESYGQLKELPGQDRSLMEQVLHGISTRDYGLVIDRLNDSFGHSAASVSRQFQERSRAALVEFEQRKFDGHRFVALFIDGKHMAGDQMVIVLGVSDKGEKIPLGIVQTNTENANSIGGLLRDLVDRGLKYDDGLLCVIDGAKGIRKAVDDVFGDAAVIQRCQWHKRENVVGYLNEGDKEKYRSKLQKAYGQDTYKEAKENLRQVHDELIVINRAAAKSLQEGLEETLTLHRLGLIINFGRSFKTTNCIENLNSCLGKYIGRVKNWSSSDMRYRWVVCGIMDMEKRMRKVDRYKKLPQMIAALKREVEQRKQKRAS
jgi:transposase-like protein